MKHRSGAAFGRFLGRGTRELTDFILKGERFYGLTTMRLYNL
jgi:hypothetical protein